MEAGVDSGARSVPKDASTVPTLLDAGGLHPPQDASSSPPDSGSSSTDDAHVPSNPTTPAPGEQFARCGGDVNCNGDLKCYGSGPGYCAQPCQTSSDCTDFEGFDFTCYLPQGACRVDCGSAGTNGACPSLLVCVADQMNNQRCQLPREQGTGDKRMMEPCDITHGSGDCVAGLACYRAGLTGVDGPGYCTQPCMLGGMGCQALMSSMPNTTFICTTRDACALTCSQSPCKPGMDCEQIGQESYCHYPAGP